MPLYRKSNCQHIKALQRSNISFSHKSQIRAHVSVYQYYNTLTVLSNLYPMENAQVSIESNLKGLFALPENIHHHLEIPIVPTSTADAAGTDDGTTSISIRFRVAEAGDALSLANLFSKVQTQNSQHYSRNDGKEEQQQNQGSKDVSAGPGSPNVVGNESPSSTSLEINIAAGLGDEQTPPAFHAIIAEVINGPAHSHVPPKSGEADAEAFPSTLKEEEEEFQSQSQSQLHPPGIELCGAAISTIDWDSQKSRRYLRVQEIAVDKSLVPDVKLLLRHFVLLFSSLAIKTACAGMLLEEHIVIQLKEGSESKPSKREIRPRLYT